MVVVVAVAWWLGLALAPRLLAQGAAPGLPPRADPYVVDFAGLLSVPHKDRMRSLIAARRRAGMPQVALLTLPSLAKFGRRENELAAFADQVFAAWNVGRDGGGALLVYVADQKALKLALAPGTPEGLATGLVATLRKDAEGRIAKGRVSEGLVIGVRRVCDALEREATVDRWLGKLSLWVGGFALLLLVGMRLGGSSVGGTLGFALAWVVDRLVAPLRERIEADRRNRIAARREAEMRQHEEEERAFRERMRSDRDEEP